MVGENYISTVTAMADASTPLQVSRESDFVAEARFNVTLIRQ